MTGPPIANALVSGLKAYEAGLLWTSSHITSRSGQECYAAASRYSEGCRRMAHVPAAL